MSGVHSGLAAPVPGGGAHGALFRAAEDVVRNDTPYNRTNFAKQARPEAILALFDSIRRSGVVL
ncbi:hypothetical protein [Phenylobacterium sp.]|uniref:hypothetical protein n=1 Tax=Phenylobacterium sp. TaxID=1871053 RepID=UPI0030027946